MAASMILTNFSGTRDAPPIRPPSMSGCASSSKAFLSFMEPPYRMEIARAFLEEYSLRTTVRMFSQTSSACSGVAVRPVPMAQMGS